ncbi:MAG TPA: P-loop NTPase [Verrucomicrobiota bacterium]|nr:P-loop NTPase [Verrucomicrobiota bacterium]HRZ38760.1 P-loop NTPase [Candidatus Paceibacterota bacterium]HRZ56951.1 P-loop NTPase [Candidatus Paceibacterota bacterium]
MNHQNRILAGQRIGLFGRGGSGKSTCAVLLAKALAKAGYAVCVVDADSTNEGLPQALGADRTPESLLAWFGGTVFSGGPVTCPVDDPVPLAGARLRADQLPGQYVAQTPEGIRMFQVGKIGPLGPGAGCDGPMTKIARDFEFETEGVAPVTLVDFKAGVEDASRGVITSLDWVVVVLDPSYAGIRAAATMKTMLDQMRAGFLPATQHLDDPERVFDEMLRVLKPGGKLVLADFSPGGFRAMDAIHRAEGRRHPHPPSRFTRFHARLRKAGFRVRRASGQNQEVLVGFMGSHLHI